jgi:DNA polymerase III epsilon subunit family exonuclease
VSSEPVRVAIDLETTGLQADQDSIIEVGAVRFAGDKMLEIYESFVAPRQPIPYRIQRLTGIRPADLAGAPSFASLLPALRSFLGDAPLVGHSVAFDAAFLRRMGLARRNPLVDTYELASALLPDLPSYTLEAVGAALGLASPSYHRALADAQLAREVFLALLGRLRTLDASIVHMLGRLAVADDWTPGYFVRAALRAEGIRVPTRALGGAEGGRAGAGSLSAGALSSLGDQLTAKLGLDPAVLSLAVARAADAEAQPAEAPPLRVSRAAADAVEAPDTADVAGVEGLLSPVSARIEIEQALTDNRRAALHGANATAAACLEDGGAALIEMEADAAGELACLEPCLRWAAANGRRLIVAAAGSASAARLARLRVPEALTRLGLAPTAMPVAEVGEQTSYLCLHRWFGAATLPHNGVLSRDLTRGLAKIAVWAGRTRTGRRGEVALTGQEQAAWERVRAGPELRDSAAGCAYWQHGYCFVAHAEEAARAARVVVTTHAALAAHLSGGSQMLPDAEGVLVLEAHLLEDELRRACSWSLELAQLAALLADLAEKRPSGGRSGLLHLAAMSERDAPEPAWFAQVSRAERAAAAFFAALGRLHAEAQRSVGRGRGTGSGEGPEQAVRLDSLTRRLAAWPEVEVAWTTLEARLQALARLAGEVAERQAPGGRAFAADGVATDLLATRRAIEAICGRAGKAIGPEQDGTVHWLRIPYGPPGPPAATATEPAPAGASPEGETPALHGARIEVGALLTPLRAPGRAMVLSGLALAAGGDFEYTCEALGLPTGEVRTCATVGSRADQTLLVLPEDAAAPNAPSYQRHLDEALIRLGTALGGRLVAIFPSHAAVRATYAGIRQALERSDVLVLAQGLDGSARQLWQTFRSQPRVVLLGAGAFWDGGELDGVPPACVVVARLPFPSLSDPVLAARAELRQDPQAQFVVPYAALRIRQALGGLAWSHGRRNAVVLFDSRVTARAYGGAVLATMPRCTLSQEPLAQVTARVVAWVDGDTDGGGG